MSEIPSIKDLFDTRYSIAEKLLNECLYPHEVLTKIKEYIKEIISLLDNEYKEISSGVFAADDANIWQGASIIGPAIIGHGAEIRPGAFIRENVIIGDNSLVGNSCEVKNSIIFNEAKLPHYNYVGDSIIGFRAHMGAGAIASNLRLDKKEIKINKIDTGLRKVGVFLGDCAEVGCNSVLCPGTIIGKSAMILPLSVVKGIIGMGETFQSL